MYNENFKRKISMAELEKEEGAPSRKRPLSEKLNMLFAPHDFSGSDGNKLYIVVLIC
jgi:hypothetical protein